MSTAAPEGEKRRRRPQLPKLPRPKPLLPGLSRPGLGRLKRGRPRLRRPGVLARLLTPPTGWTLPRILAGLILLLALVAGLAAPGLVSLLGLKGPAVRDPSALNLFGNPTGPSSAYPLGVDSAGRDVLSRSFYGLRSLLLLGLAGTGLAALAGGALAALAQLNRWAALVVSIVLGALRAFPPVLLGLGLALGLGPGFWQLLTAITLVVLVPVPLPLPLPLTRSAVRAWRAARWREGLRWLMMFAPRFVAMLRNALAIDFALTFLGDGPGGNGPQLGAMVARAGLGVLAGVPAWWELLFPGLAVMLVITAASVLAARGLPAVPPRLRLWARTRGGYVADRCTVAALRAACVIGLGAVMFASLGGAGGAAASGGVGGAGTGALARVGPDLAATVSLLLGGVVVWGLVTLAQLRLGTRAHVRRRLAPDRLARLPALALGAAPAGWLGFLALYLFSNSVGKAPILPGAHTYVGLTQAPGRWAQSLVIPWLLLGLCLAARSAPALARAIRAEERSGQQRVARAAGVPEGRLARQRRRALLAPLLELVDRELVTLIGVLVLLEATFQIPGVGALAVGDFGHGQAAGVSDIAVLAALVVLAAGLILDLVRGLVDPPLASASPVGASPREARG